MKYQCPVCGYPDLEEPPTHYNICSSCGTEFANDDFDKSHAELRNEWISRGAPWFSKFVPRPEGWSALDQLNAAGFSLEPDQVERLSRARNRVLTTREAWNEMIGYNQTLAGLRVTHKQQDAQIRTLKVTCFTHLKRFRKAGDAEKIEEMQYYLSELETMTRIQQIIRQDMARVQKTISSTQRELLKTIAMETVGDVKSAVIKQINDQVASIANIFESQDRKVSEIATEFPGTLSPA